MFLWLRFWFKQFVFGVFARADAVFWTRPGILRARRAGFTKNVPRACAGFDKYAPRARVWRSFSAKHASYFYSRGIQRTQNNQNNGKNILEFKSILSTPQEYTENAKNNCILPFHRERRDLRRTPSLSIVLTGLAYFRPHRWLRRCSGNRLIE